MDSKEIHDAMRDRLPVVCDGRRYDRIAEFVSWYGEDRRHRLSVVLMEGRNSIRVSADKVELAERDNCIPKAQTAT